jgi:hypothetical protein
VSGVAAPCFRNGSRFDTASDRVTLADRAGGLRVTLNQSDVAGTTRLALKLLAFTGDAVREVVPDERALALLVLAAAPGAHAGADTTDAATVRRQQFTVATHERGAQTQARSASRHGHLPRPHRHGESQRAERDLTPRRRAQLPVRIPSKPQARRSPAQSPSFRPASALSAHSRSRSGNSAPS